MAENEKKICRGNFKLALGVLENEISHSVLSSIFFYFLLFLMAERTPESAVWGYFLCVRQMAKLHALTNELKMTLIARDDMVQMTFSQSFVTIPEVVAGVDVRLIGLS